MIKRPRKVFIAMPTYGGVVHVDTHRAIIDDIATLWQTGFEVTQLTYGGSDLCRVRAQHLAHFLADEDATDYITIDSDVSWAPPGLPRLLSHDVDIVAGLYPRRSYPLDFPFMSSLDAGQPLTGDPERRLVELTAVPFGFVRLRRAVVEAMCEKYAPMLAAKDNRVPQGAIVRLFDPYWSRDENGDPVVLAEDYSFCRRATDMGYRIWGDLEITMGHAGMHLFEGNISDWLAAKSAEHLQEKAA